MNNLSIASVIEKNKISSNSSFVFGLDINIVNPVTGAHVETVYLVNHTESLTHNGKTYQRIGFNLDLSSESGEIQNLSLTVQDQVGFILPYLQQYRGAVGSEVIVSLFTVAEGQTEVSFVDFSERFEVIASSSANYITSFELGAENPLTRMAPARTQLRDRCSFRYKSKECGYDGALPSCDLTLTGSNGCRAHDNEARYGGCPSINKRSQ